MVLGGFWWNSGRPGGFLVDFLPVSGGFCGSGRFSVECGLVVDFVVLWSGGFLVDFLLGSGGFCGSGRFSAEFWMVW